MEDRTYALRQPPGHKPPVPRWQLVFPESITSIFTAYIGVQGGATAPIVDWIAQASACQSVERFTHVEGDDVQGSSIWVCYWDDATRGKERLATLDLPAIHASLPPAERETTGFWCESFGTPIDRVETNYTGLDYLPGVAQLPGTKAEPHTLTAYWGAARDRIPASAHDLFPESDGAKQVRGTNSDNVVHIRSGQFWESCPPEEAASYEEHLEPTMLNGLRYLWDTRDVSTAAGLRYIRNVDGTATPRKETCAIGFFASLGRLESWAAKHQSHVAIYTGAIRHAKKFGEGRKFRTWHEVSVLKAGEASFEYINCAPGTGVFNPR